MPVAPAQPYPDFDLTSAYPEMGRLRTALVTRDWAGARAALDTAPEPSGRTMLIRFAATVRESERFLQEVLARDPDDSAAGSMLGGRLIEAGWEVRTRASA